MLKHFEHIGMATSDLDACLHFYCDLIGCKLLLRKANPRSPGEVAFIDAGGAQLEIFAPGGLKTPARTVPNDEVGLRHLTFTFENIDETYAMLMAAGVEGIEKPRDAYNREMLARVAFVRDPDGMIIELAQR